MNQFKVGTIVTWTSQAGGYSKTKVGRVFCIVPAHQDPHGLISDPFSLDKGTAWGRNHTTYLVQVGNSKRLYWPRVCHLKSVSPCTLCQENLIPCPGTCPQEVP